MEHTTHTDDPAPTPAPVRTITTTPVETASQPNVVVQSTEPERRGFSFGSFLAGFVTAAIVAAIALGVFLAVSDADDDGNIQLEVPAVDVDTGG